MLLIETEPLTHIFQLSIWITVGTKIKFFKQILFYLQHLNNSTTVVVTSKINLFGHVLFYLSILDKGDLIKENFDWCSMNDFLYFSSEWSLPSETNYS